MRWRFLLVVCITTALIIGAGVSPVVAAEVDALAWTEWMPTTRLAYDVIPAPPGRSWSHPDVQGDWAVWQVTSNASTDWNVYAYNLLTRTQITVSAGAGHQENPRIHGSWVVYDEEQAGGARDIYAFDVLTKTTRRLTNRAGIQHSPDIWGTRVVYSDAETGRVHLYDLSTGVDRALALGAGNQSTGRISGDRIVYLQDNDVGVYDLRTGAIARLTNDAMSDIRPDIDGTLVAWQRGTGGGDIWCQDLAGGVAFAAVESGDPERDPRVSGSKVVYYRSLGGGKYQLGVFDARLRKDVNLTAATTSNAYPAIDGNSIVYVSNYTAQNDISLGRLLAPQLSASGPSAPVKYASINGISGSLVENGIPLGGMPIKIDRSYDGGHTWSEVAAATTDAGGGYAFSTPKLYRKAHFRVRYDGGVTFLTNRVDHFSALSPVVTITPRASVGKPTGYPSTGSRKKSYSVYGSLKPRQAGSAAAAKAVVIKCYRYEKGKWRYKKSVSAKVYDYSTYSRYKASVKLTSSGTWRMRAYFKATDTNAATHSAYVKVKVR